MYPLSPTKQKIGMGVQEEGVHLRCKWVNFEVAPAYVAPLMNVDARELGWLPNLDTKSYIDIAQIYLI